MSNEISEDFKNLVGEKKQGNDHGHKHKYESDSESDSSIRHSEIKASAPVNAHKQMMDQQFMMQQQMKQQQQLREQQQAVQQKIQVPVAKVGNGQEVEIKKENFGEQKSILKTVSKLAVVLALFFVFASPQSAGLLNYIPYLGSLPFTEYINLFIRALLFVIVYFVLETFVL